MIVGLMVDTVSNYTGGAVALQEVLGVNVKIASGVLATLVALAVAGGGLHGMGVTNLIHIVVKYAALIIIAVAAWKLLGENPLAQDRIPPTFYTVEGTGVSQLFSWTIANIGAVFATQYVMQAVSALRSSRQAIGAGVIASAMMLPVGMLGAFIGVAARGLYPVPVGMLGAFIGVAARGLYPDIKSEQAVPVFFDQLSPVTAGIVTAGIVAAALVSLSALVIGATTLIMKDFYVPLAKAKSKESVLAVRIIAIVLCALPLPFVWFVPDILGVVFLSRGLRAAIGVLVVFMFYLPSIGSGRGAIVGLLSSLVGTTTWYALDDPFGVDNTYVAIALPIMCMLIDALITRSKSRRDVSPVAVARPSQTAVS
jgi:SSS family solute:Na+ symporter